LAVLKGFPCFLLGFSPYVTLRGNRLPASSTDSAPPAPADRVGAHPAGGLGLRANHPPHGISFFDNGRSQSPARNELTQLFARPKLYRGGTTPILGRLKLEIFTLCDSAVDYGGKVCILGAFDSLSAAEAPYTVTHCAVVARMRFHRIEEGNHKLRVTLADQDGKMIMPNVDAQVGVRFTEQAQSATFNLVMQINGLKLDQFGEYTVDLAVDGVHQGSLPLYFSKTPQPTAPDSTFE